MDMTVTICALSALSALCEFIFSHSEVVPPDITAMTIGLSPSIVTLRINGSSLSRDGIAEDMDGLLSKLRGYGVTEVSFIEFNSGTATRSMYSFNESGKAVASVKAGPDTAQDGVFIRISLKEDKSTENKPVSTIWKGLSDLIDTMENPPVLERVSVFLNGERMD